MIRPHSVSLVVLRRGIQTVEADGYGSARCSSRLDRSLDAVIAQRRQDWRLSCL
jgi:hypothetical protein